MIQEQQKKLMKELKKLYKKYNLERTFYYTSDGSGIYVHPKKGRLYSRRSKRVGIFLSVIEDIPIEYLSLCDDELGKKIKGE